MKNKRIRIVAKERRALDIGKFVLAVIGVAEAKIAGEQLSLPLDDARKPGTSSPSSSKSVVSNPDQGSSDAADQLALPLDDISKTSDKEVA